jgi:biotin transport system substrate-specific component
MSVFWGVFLIVLTSQISIPLQPVPITLQTCSIMFIGLCLERRVAIASVLSYLMLGMIGAPVFADFSGGYAQLIGPTGGYLVGFLGSVMVMTTLKKVFNNVNAFYNLLNCVIGTVVVFIMGICWLSKFVGFEQAIQVGLMPFILPGLIKAALLTLLVRYVKRTAINGDL